MLSTRCDAFRSILSLLKSMSLTGEDREPVRIGSLVNDLREEVQRYPVIFDNEVDCPNVQILINRKSLLSALTVLIQYLDSIQQRCSPGGKWSLKISFAENDSASVLKFAWKWPLHSLADRLREADEVLDLLFVDQSSYALSVLYAETVFRRSGIKWTIARSDELLGLWAFAFPLL